MDGSTQIYVDKNNGKSSHPGIMTNEPPYDWHVENIKHYEVSPPIFPPVVQNT
jgi:penicillin V acylase-like amidase (Ntn superfamily)